MSQRNKPTCRTCKLWNPYRSRHTAKEGFCEKMGDVGRKFKTCWSFEEEDRQVDTHPSFYCRNYRGMSPTEMRADTAIWNELEKAK